MILYYVTSNQEKIKRLRDALKRYSVNDISVQHVLMDLPEPRSDDMQIIAEKKARYAFSEIQAPCLVQDTGFFISSLNGFPRGFVNFTLETIGLEGILKLVEGKSRECEFRDCLAYFNGTKGFDFHYFQTIAKGTVAPCMRGVESPWSLHRIFIPFGENRTLAEMSNSERDNWRANRRDDYYANQFARWAKDNFD